MNEINTAAEQHRLLIQDLERQLANLDKCNKASAERMQSDEMFEDAYSYEAFKNFWADSCRRARMVREELARRSR